MTAFSLDPLLTQLHEEGLRLVGLTFHPRGGWGSEGAWWGAEVSALHEYRPAFGSGRGAEGAIAGAVEKWKRRAKEVGEFEPAAVIRGRAGASHMPPRRVVVGDAGDDL
jgi:hypothetical protein